MLVLLANHTWLDPWYLLASAVSPYAGHICKEIYFSNSPVKGIDKRERRSTENKQCRREQQKGRWFLIIAEPRENSEHQEAETSMEQGAKTCSPYWRIETLPRSGKTHCQLQCQVKVLTEPRRFRKLLHKLVGQESAVSPHSVILRWRYFYCHWGSEPMWEKN